MQFLTHHTEELVWREPYLDHPNGARSLRSVWIAATDPAEAVQRFCALYRPAGPPRGKVSTVALERGTVRIATPEFLERELGVEPGPPLPYLAAYEVEVASLPRLHEHLASSELAQVPVRGGVAVRPSSSLGGTILFRRPAV